jgi:hypothetical protein
MTFDLRFLPEVEDDVIGGYSWYEERPVDLERNSFVCYMPAPMNSPVMHCFTKRCMVIFGGVFLDDFHIRSIFE